MTITEIEKYIHELFLINGFQPWKVEFHYTNKYAGSCYYYQKVIRISLHEIEKLTSAQIRQVCLHEFCHAFSYLLYGTTGHDEYWQGTCELMQCPDDLVIYYRP